MGHCDCDQRGVEKRQNICLSVGDWGIKTVVSRVQNVPVQISRPGFFSLAVLAWEIPSSHFSAWKLFFIVQSHQFIFPNTTCKDKILNRVRREWQKENWTYEGSVAAKRGNGHFLHFPIPFISSHHVEGSLPFFTKKEKVGSQKKKGGKYNNRSKGEGKEWHKNNKKCIKS